MEKQTLRSRMKQRLCALDDADRFACSRAACRHAVATEAFQNAGTLLCYAAMPEEADPAALVCAARAAGKRVAFPYCLPGRRMLALEPWDEAAWALDSYGIRTPLRERAREIPPEELDLIVTPGLAFDCAGNRLGRGAGYYDGFLPRTRAMRMGFCLSVQLVEALPIGAHDIPMDLVVTERGVLRAQK